MKVLGAILIAVGILMILGTVGQSDMETFAMTHGKTIETVPFKTQVLTILSGTGGIGFGLAILRGGN